jgi:hypothetical protein
MIILIHVLIALSSLALSSVTFFKPTIKNLKFSYGLIIATVTSGVFLVVLNSSNILHSCLAGLAYLGAVLAITAGARVRASQLLLSK